MSLLQMRSSLRYQARLVGVAEFDTHMLRRREPTSMVAADKSMKVVASVLGHAKAQTTAAYLRVDVGKLRAVAAELSDDDRGRMSELIDGYVKYKRSLGFKMRIEAHTHAA